MTDTNSNDEGIDIRQALEILSARSTSGDDHHHHHHPSAAAAAAGGCSHIHPQEVPANAKSMGQTIDLLRENNITDSAVVQQAQEAEALQNKVQEERAQRKQELEQKIQSMTVKELLQSVLEAQQERVRTYGLYNR